MRTILKPYCNIINLLARISCRMDERTRVFSFNTSVLLISFICVLHYCNDRLQEICHYSNDATRVISPILLIIVLLSCIDDRVDFRNLKPNRLFWIGWLVCFTTMFVMSFVHPVKKMYFLWSILSLTIFPMIMIAFSCSRLSYKWSVLLAKDTVVISYVFLLMNIIITPMTTNTYPNDDYLGLCSNPNANGLICSAFFTAAMYLFFVERKHPFFSLLSMGVSTAIIVISVCRTAQLIVLIDVVIAICTYIVHYDEHKKEWAGRIVVVACIAAIILSCFAGHLLKKFDKIDINAYAETTYEEVYQWTNENETRVRLNQLSSGRLMLWKAYSTKLNFWGNGKSDGPLMPELTASKWPHNNALEIWYISGFIAFVGYAMWILTGFIFAVKCLRRNTGYRRDYFLTLLSFIGYFIFAMLEITLYPMVTGIFFLLCMTLGNLAFDTDLKEE